METNFLSASKKFDPLFLGKNWPRDKHIHLWKGVCEAVLCCHVHLVKMKTDFAISFWCQIYSFASINFTLRIWTRGRHLYLFTFCLKLSGKSPIETFEYNSIAVTFTKKLELEFPRKTTSIVPNLQTTCHVFLQ